MCASTLSTYIISRCTSSFFNTTNEFPEIYKFIKTVDNVLTIQPGTNLKKVIEKVGFPLISKQQSRFIFDINNTKSTKLLKKRLIKTENNKVGVLSNKWYYLIDQDFEISDKCCDYLKKRPAHKFHKEKGLFPFTGQMAEESRLRKLQYIKTGCNNFDATYPISNPISIWTTKDIWKYIKKFNVPYSTIYDKGVERTGCMFCGYGSYRENRFEWLKKNYRKHYDIVMKYSNNGVSYEEALKIYNKGIKKGKNFKNIGEGLFDLRDL